MRQLIGRTMIGDSTFVQNEDRIIQLEVRERVRDRKHDASVLA